MCLMHVDRCSDFFLTAYNNFQFTCFGGIVLSFPDHEMAACVF